MTRLTGLSITQGATTPLLRMPAISVVVFQCPCGTAMRRRSPRGQRPYLRAIFVLAQLSSTKIRRSGSRSN